MVGRPHVMRGISKFLTALMIGALLALPAGAIAQSSSDGGYNQPGGVVQDQIQAEPRTATGGDEGDDSTPTAAKATANPTESDAGGKLPFTGLDLALIVGAGGVLMLVGFGIRRFTSATELA